MISGRRAARRSASASVVARPRASSGLSTTSAATGAGDGDRGVKLIVLPQYPPPLALTHDLLGAGLGGGTVLDLDVDVVGVGSGQQLLLQRLPVGRVVDVIGDVALRGPEHPWQ